MSRIITLAAPAFHLLSIRNQTGRKPVSLTGAMMPVQNVLKVMDSYLKYISTEPTSRLGSAEQNKKKGGGGFCVINTLDLQIHVVSIWKMCLWLMHVFLVKTSTYFGITADYIFHYTEIFLMISYDEAAVLHFFSSFFKLILQSSFSNNTNILQYDGLTCLQWAALHTLFTHALIGIEGLTCTVEAICAFWPVPLYSGS